MGRARARVIRGALAICRSLSAWHAGVAELARVPSRPGTLASSATGNGKRLSLVTNPKRERGRPRSRFGFVHPSKTTPTHPLERRADDFAARSGGKRPKHDNVSG